MSKSRLVVFAAEGSGHVVHIDGERRTEVTVRGGRVHVRRLVRCGGEWFLEHEAELASACSVTPVSPRPVPGTLHLLSEAA